MARLRVKGNRLVVRLNALEKVMAFRLNVRVPLNAVESVEVQRRPRSKSPAADGKMGFAARGAPGPHLPAGGPGAEAEGRRGRVPPFVPYCASIALRPIGSGDKGTYYTRAF